jgi:hypothetical protein
MVICGTLLPAKYLVRQGRTVKKEPALLTRQLRVRNSAAREDNHFRFFGRPLRRGSDGSLSGWEEQAKW